MAFPFRVTVRLLGAAIIALTAFACTPSGGGEASQSSSAAHGQKAARQRPGSEASPALDRLQALWFAERSLERVPVLHHERLARGKAGSEVSVVFAPYEYAVNVDAIDSLAAVEQGLFDFHALALLARDGSHDLHEAALRTLERRFPDAPIQRSMQRIAYQHMVEGQAQIEMVDERLPVVLPADRAGVYSELLRWWDECRHQLAWDEHQKAFLASNHADETLRTEDQANVTSKLAASMRSLADHIAERIASSGGGSVQGSSGGMRSGHGTPVFKDWSIRLPGSAIDPSEVSDWLALWSDTTQGLPESSRQALALLCLRDADDAIHEFGVLVLQQRYGVSFDANELVSTALSFQSNEQGAAVKEIKLASYLPPSQREQAFYRACKQLRAAPQR